MDDREMRLRSLMIAALAGDAASYRLLLDALRRLLEGYFRRRLGPQRSADVDDLVQETLVAMHGKRATYDPDRPFTPWLHAVARHKLIDHLRRDRSHQALPIEAAEAAIFGDADADNTARLDVERLLATLPERSRTLIRQVRIEGRSVAEAAAAAGMSEAAARVGIHRGVRRLTARLQGRKP